SGRTGRVPLEPCIGRLPQPFSFGSVESSGLTPPLDVDLEGLRVCARRERTRAFAPARVAVHDPVSPLAARGPVGAGPCHRFRLPRTRQRRESRAVVLGLEPARDLVLVEEAAPLDLERGQLTRRSEPVDLLGLATKNGGELVDGEEGR